MNKNGINQEISYWPSYRSEVSRIGPWHSAITADLRSVPGPTRKHLINNISLVHAISHCEIKTHRV